jgi:hypothetical protein
VGLFGSRYSSLQASHGLDKSGVGTRQVRYPPLEADAGFWKPLISLDLEKGFWMVKHLGLSLNIFGASLLIVRLSYDSNKI